MSFLPNQAIYPLPGAIEAVSQRVVVELISLMHSPSEVPPHQETEYMHLHWM